MAVNNLQDVLVDLLKDTYHAEKQLVKALPRMAKAATSDDLRAAFQSHLTETERHVDRLEKVFAALEMKPVAKVCHGMMGLVQEGKEVIDEKSGSNPTALDAALIAAAQKVEHYEICAYGTLATFAEQLGRDDLAELLKATLNEEEAADEKLNGIAEGSVNAEAAEAGGEDDEEEGESNSSRAKAGRRAAAASGRDQRR